MTAARLFCVLCLALFVLGGCGGSGGDDAEYAQVYGRVVDSSTGAAVTTRGNIYLHGQYAYLSSGSSEFQFFNIDPGDYTITATVAGYAVKSQVVALHGGDNNLTIRVDKAALLEGEFDLGSLFNYGDFSIMDLPINDTTWFDPVEQSDFSVGMDQFGLVYIPRNGAGWQSWSEFQTPLPETGYKSTTLSQAAGWYAWKTRDGKYALLKFRNRSWIVIQYKMRWDGGRAL